MPAHASAPRLLVVDDDATQLSLVQAVLEEEGYAVTPATSLSTSLRALEEHLFHLVLTDLFAAHSQAPLQSIHPLIEQAAPTPVGVMTAWRVPEAAVTQADLAFVLQKPFDLVDLLGQVDAVLHPTIKSLRQLTLVEQFFNALNARDWPRLARLCAPDVKMSPAGNVASVRLGLPGYLAYLEQRLRRLPDYTLEEVQVFPRQDGVATRYLARWHSRDGCQHRASGAMRFRFRQGRIAQIDGE